MLGKEEVAKLYVTEQACCPSEKITKEKMVSIVFPADKTTPLKRPQRMLFFQTPQE